MEEDNVRDRLVKFLEDEGITQKQISKKTSIAPTALSMFKTGKAGLYPPSLKLLDRYLRERGY